MQSCYRRRSLAKYEGKNAKRDQKNDEKLKKLLQNCEQCVKIAQKEGRRSSRVWQFRHWHEMRWIRIYAYYERGRVNAAYEETWTGLAAMLWYVLALASGFRWENPLLAQTEVTWWSTQDVSPETLCAWDAAMQMRRVSDYAGILSGRWII